MLKPLQVSTKTIDMETGAVIDERMTPFHILAPVDGSYIECAIHHAPDQPHNAQTLQYQYTFYARHDRWPTWADAMAHCSKGTRELWEEALRERGAWSEPEKNDG